MKQQRQVQKVINHYTFSKITEDPEMPESCVLEINCKSWGDDTVTGERVQIAQSSFLLIIVYSEKFEHSWFTVLDLDPGTARYLDLIDSEGVGVSDSVANTILNGLCDPSEVAELFIIDRVQVHPDYQGNGYGESIMTEAMKKFSEESRVIATIPFPLQFEQRHESEVTDWEREISMDNLPRDKDLSINKLHDYYSRIGFHKVTDAVYAKANPYTYKF